MLNKLNNCISYVNKVLLGKELQVKLAITCLLAKGHLLLEDLPGMGKTTLSQALAKVMGLSFQRIQFTSDLLPGDILGTSVFDKNSGEFIFHAGPIFVELVLADEINRATPKSQGGTFALPDSQLDRFLMRLSLGYPAQAAEKALLMGKSRRSIIPLLKPVLTRDELKKAQNIIPQIKASEAIIDYILRLVTASRTQDGFGKGLSPRTSLGLLASARAWAFLAGRDYVIPEDVQVVLPAVVGHRLHDQVGLQGGALVQQLLTKVAVI